MQQEHEHQRPDGVVLLLYRQRPGVAQRRGHGELVEVGLPAEHRPPVRDVADRRQGVAAQLVELLRLGDHDGVDGNAREHEEERGQEASGASGPEGDEADPALRPPLVQKQAGDQKAAEHEEGVDAEEAAARPGHAGVIGQHRQNGQRAHAIERGMIREASSGGRRCFARRGSLNRHQDLAAQAQREQTRELYYAGDGSSKVIAGDCNR